MQSSDEALGKLRTELDDLLTQWNNTIQIQTQLFSKISNLSSQLNSVISGKHGEPTSSTNPPSLTQPTTTVNNLMKHPDKVDEVKLSEEQQSVCDLVKSRKNVFFTGSAGTGKSFLLHHIVKMLRCSFKTIAVTASTGIAASLIGGTTLHKFSGVGVPTVIEDFGRMWDKKETWRNLDCLIIDEISMISGEFFTHLERTVCSIMEDPRPFGGIQIICCGDFCQLPPVFKYTPPDRRIVRQTLSKSEPFEPATMCFESEAWKKCDFTVCHLTKVFRQTEAQFVRILQELRFGVVSPEGEELLESCNRPLPEDGGIKPTILFPKKANVQKENQKQLLLLKSQPMLLFKSVDTIDVDDMLRDSKQIQMATRELEETEFFKNCQSPEFLELKVGAQVMLVKNLSDSFVNGSRGVVVKWVSIDTLNLMLEHQDSLLETSNEPPPGIQPSNSKVLIIDSNGVIHKTYNDNNSIANNNNNHNIKPPLTLIKKVKHLQMSKFPGTVINQHSSYEDYLHDAYGYNQDDSDNENEYSISHNGTPAPIPKEDLYLIDDFLALPRDQKMSILEFIDSEKVETLQHLALLGKCYDPHIPLVRFTENRERFVAAEEFSTEISGAGFCYRYQVPLMLAWALTIHKCQGLTLDKAEMDLSQVFASGHAYVAISRVRSLKGMSLKGFRRSIVKTDRKVLEFYGIKEKRAEWSDAAYKRKRTKENDSCFRCQQKGHWATDCPNKNSRFKPERGYTPPYPLEE